MISVTEIAFTGYSVTDIARARAFYEGLLNLKPTFVYDQDGKHWIEYEIGASTLVVSNMNPGWKSSAQGPSVVLEVADFDVAVKETRAAGVRFMTEPMSFPSCQLVVVLDPDGNSLTLHRRNPE